MRTGRLWGVALTAFVIASSAGSVSCVRRQSADPARGPARLDRAITRATAALLADQEPDGHWSGVASLNTAAVSDAYGFTGVYALLLNRLGIDDDSRRDALQYLIGAQRGDGGWGEASSDFAGALALQQAGREPDAEPVRRALAAAERRGDTLERANAIVKLFYALDGRYDWDRLRITGALTTGGRSESQVARTAVESRDIAISMSILKTVGPGTPLSRPQLEAIKQAESLLLARQLSTGSWFEYEAYTICGALALHQLGYLPTAQPITRALAFLRSLQQPDGSVSALAEPITETALALLTLESAGLDTSDARVRRAAQYIVDSRMPAGGWGFTPALRIVPDWDDVSLGLGALGPFMPTVAASAAPYAFSLQNADGGWATYARDANPDRAYVRSVPISESARMTWDPSLPDITGHMLLAFGRNGYRLTDARLARAREYLRRVQFENGMWFGYWGVAYLYGTSAALLGLEAVHEDPSAPYERRAVEWVKAIQQPEGCWGEDVRAMRDVAYAGRGRCTPVQTAWGVIALLAGGEPADAAPVRRGVDWLIDRQRADGAWDADNVLFAHVIEYHLAHDAINWPLFAIAKYRNARHPASWHLLP